MPLSSGEERTRLIYDVVSLKRVGVPFVFPRFFAPDLLARLRKGYNVAWLPARPLGAVLGVGRQAMANAIARACKFEDFRPRSASLDEVCLLQQAGFMSKYTTEATLVTVPHAVSIFNGRSGVTPGLLSSLKALGTKPPSDDPPTATEIREMKAHSLQRVRLMPTGPVGGASRTAGLEGEREVDLRGHYGLTRDDVARSARLSREFGALGEFYRSRINLRRLSRALADMTVNNILSASRSFLGFVSKSRGVPPSLACCLDGDAIHAYLGFLSERAGERTSGAEVASPMTEVHFYFPPGPAL